MQKTYSVLEKLLLLLYTFWWIYVFYYMYLKGYENTYTDFIPSLAFGILVVAVLGVYFMGFLLVMIKSKRKKHYWKVLGYIVLPALIVIYLEFVQPFFA